MTTEGGLVAAVVDTDSFKTEIKELKYRRWSRAVHDYVSVDLFRYVHFINREEDVMFGSGIQKVVCNLGSDKVQEVMKWKGQIVATSFRSQFDSKQPGSVG
jgi:hypothetical protein